MSNFHLTKKSSNSKTGPLAVTVSSSDTCPPACSFYAKGCYAKGGPLNMHWKAVDNGERGTSFDGLLAALQALPAGQKGRFNAAGDLPGLGNDIDRPALQAMTAAVQGRSFFTYTHKPITLRAARRGGASIATVRANRAAVSEANLHGLTINVSCDSLTELDELGDALPAVVVLPQPEAIPSPADASLTPTERRNAALNRGIAAAPKTLQTPEGRRVVVCPAQYRDDTTCDTCQLCSRVGRSAAVGFWAHGYAKNIVSKIAGKTHLGVMK